MFTKASIVALFATTVAAIGTPTTLSGNPISKPGLNEIVPACKEYTITWQATSTVPVSIRLLRGPSENVVPLGEPLAVSIPNTGSFKWTPASSLEADTTHYGLQIIEDSGNYQWSTQFGISTDACKDAPAPKPTVTGAGYPTKPTSTPSEGYPTSSVNSTSAYPTKVSKTSSVVLSTGYPVSNISSIVQPTKSLSVPSSLKTSATGSPSSTGPDLPESTGAASSVKVGLGLLGAAALAFML